MTDMEMANAMIGTGMVSAALMMSQVALVEVVTDGPNMTNQLIVRFPGHTYGISERGYLVTVTIPEGVS